MRAPISQFHQIAAALVQPLRRRIQELVDPDGLSAELLAVAEPTRRRGGSSLDGAQLPTQEHHSGTPDQVRSSIQHPRNL